jgi:hypothetical protein
VTGRVEHGDLIIIMSSDYGAELYSEGSVMTARPEKTASSKAQLEEMAESVGFWGQRLDLGQGVVRGGLRRRDPRNESLDQSIGTQTVAA